MKISQIINNIFNLRNNYFILELYKELLNREPTENEIKIINNEHNMKMKLLKIAASKEFNNLISKKIQLRTNKGNQVVTKIRKMIFSNIPKEKFIIELFNEFLLRDPTIEEINILSNSLNLIPKNYAINLFLKNEEFLKLVASPKDIYTRLHKSNIEKDKIIPLPSNNYEIKVTFKSAIYPPVYGFTNSTINILHAMDKEGIDVTYRCIHGEEPLDRDDPLITVLRNKEVDENKPEIIYGSVIDFLKSNGKYKIGYTMTEVSGISHEWAEICNTKVQEIWLPTQFNIFAFLNSGVKTPIYKIPLGINNKIFHPFEKSFRYSEKFTFLSLFQWSLRKGPDLLLKAFNKAFEKNNDVVLVIKTTSYTFESLKEEIGKYSKYLNSKIIIDNRRLPEYLLGDIYRAADCFVFPTRAEGWGMPILEAMACGLPTIATGWGCQTEFFNKENGAYPLRFKLKKLNKSTKIYKNHCWAEPSLEHLVHLMRYIYENQDKVIPKAKELGKKIIKDWSYENTARKIKERLKQLNL